MTNYLRKLLILPASASNLRQQQTEEAELLALDHRAQAEMHAAMATMYDAMVVRLKDTTVTASQF